ncbi:Hypothetical predicted protein [Mytilus galloprovincialis]|uniref:Uncharacterized protein n=1 Tax=Mytilus galloprovincialis TaxID=29158 RepID=A0A8B6DH24_MYTGA|nr:Hypothetical predicted protein [Mytilus galloprovincialis]
MRNILDSQSTSSRSNSPILNPPPSYSELVREVHVDQVTDVTDANEQTEEGEQNNQLPPIHFDEGTILDSQSTSSRSNSPILNPPP